MGGSGGGQRFVADGRAQVKLRLMWDNESHGMLAKNDLCECVCALGFLVELQRA